MLVQMMLEKPLGFRGVVHGSLEAIVGRRVWGGRGVCCRSSIIRVLGIKSRKSDLLCLLGLGRVSMVASRAIRA
jgi:hypothetical protein